MKTDEIIKFKAAIHELQKFINLELRRYQHFSENTVSSPVKNLKSIAALLKKIEENRKINPSEKKLLAQAGMANVFLFYNEYRKIIDEACEDSQNEDGSILILGNSKLLDEQALLEGFEIINSEPQPKSKSEFNYEDFLEKTPDEKLKSKSTLQVSDFEDSCDDSSSLSFS